MAEYYLISQLPSLDGVGETAPLPITEEQFGELCRRFLGKKAQGLLEKLTLSPAKQGESSGSAFIDTFNENERQLRFALGKVRAEKRKTSFDMGHRLLPMACLKAASIAVEMDNPMEAETYLNRYRLDMLEAQRPMDNFSEEFLLYYGLKLKLLLRIRQFDKAAGEAAYRTIYNSILSGDGWEAIS